MSAFGANAKAPTPGIVKAHSFELVDRDGNTAGVFAVQDDRVLGETIVLYNAQGQTIWRAGNGMEPLSATQ